MPRKRIHLQQAKHTRKQAHIVSVLLPNGNLVVPKIVARDPFVSCWVEVEPGTSDFKRWWSVHETNMPDPRKLPGYQSQLKEHDPSGRFTYTLAGVFHD